MAATSQNVGQWIRDLLGPRKFLRAMNNAETRARIEGIAREIDRGRLDSNLVRGALARASATRDGLDNVLRELEASLPTPAASPDEVPALAADRDRERARKQEEEFEALVGTVIGLRNDLISARNMIHEMDGLLRELVLRAVLDATRIRGLENALMALASATGDPRLQRVCEEVYSRSTAEYLAPRLKKIAV